MIPPMQAWPSKDTRATRSCWSDLDIVTNQAHLPVPIRCIRFAGSHGRRYYNNQRYPKSLSCNCCCWRVSNCWVCSCAVMSFAVTEVFRVTGKPRMCFCISSPMLSEYRIVTIESATFSGCVCAVSIPRGGSSRLFPEISLQRFLLNGCCKYTLDTLEGIQTFGFQSITREAGKIKPIGSWYRDTVVLLHSIVAIYVGTDIY